MELTICLFYSLPEPNASSSNKSEGEDHNEPPNRDQLVYEYFSKRFDELFYEKCMAESKVINYVTEVCKIYHRINQYRFKIIFFFCSVIPWETILIYWWMK